ncbi:restriction endonuclease subunit S [Ureaplasma diversum]|uniref:restriction endonuclease subunit S n=1 Tax=Ureaplasma diversum TaxID=42094 RepID=UPI00056ED8D4|nr:restriction endonuclease subunit S [Ureaplasma diversum]
MENILKLIKNEKVEWKRLGDVCEFKRCQYITKKDIIDGDIPVVSGGIKPAYYHGISNRDGIIITVAGSGVNAGFVSYWDQPIFLGDAFSVEPIENLNKRYLYHWLISVQDKIYGLKQGAGIAHVYSKDLARFIIPIPPLEVQNYIASILDQFDSLTSNLSEGLPKEIELRQKQYEYYRDQLLSFNSNNE